MKYFCLVILLMTGMASAGDLRGGIFLNGSTLEIKVRVVPGSGDFTSEISALAVSVKYSSSLAAGFGAAESPTPMDLSLQTEQSSGGFTYRFYSWVGANTPQWTQGSETVILRIPLSGLTGNEEFFLCSDHELVNGNDPNFYIESPTGGGYFQRLYKSGTSAPLAIGNEAAPHAAHVTVWPNPTFSTATVAWNIQTGANTSLEIADASGRSVRVLNADSFTEAGEYRTSIDTGALPCGAYQLVLRSDGRKSRTTLVIVR